MYVLVGCLRWLHIHTPPTTPPQSCLKTRSFFYRSSRIVMELVAYSYEPSQIKDLELDFLKVRQSSKPPPAGVGRSRHLPWCNDTPPPCFTLWPFAVRGVFSFQRRPQRRAETGAHRCYWLWATCCRCFILQLCVFLFVLLLLRSFRVSVDASHRVYDAGDIFVFCLCFCFRCCCCFSSMGCFMFFSSSPPSC